METLPRIRRSDLKSCLTSVEVLLKGGLYLEDAFDPLWVERQFEIARVLFSCSETELLSACRQEMTSGYTPFGVEGVRGTEQVWRDFWDEFVPSPLHVSHPVLRGVSEELREGLSELEKLALEVLAVVDLRCGSQLSEIAVGGMHLLRLNHYPATGERMIAFPSHSDFGILTLFFGQSTLEVDVDGEWELFQIQPGDVGIGFGTTTHLFVPQIPCLRHRVWGEWMEQFSITFFMEPRPEVRLPTGETAGEQHQRLMRKIRTPLR